MHLLVDMKIGFCFSMDVKEAHLDCSPLESSVSYVSSYVGFKIFLCHRYCNSALPVDAFAFCYVLTYFLLPQVAVSTVIEDEKEFLNHIVKATNMKCLTPP